MLTQFKQLQEMQIVMLSILKITDASNITFNEVREDERTINRVTKYLETPKQQKEEKFKKM